MNWHYLENNVQKGPITNEELEALFRAGKVDYNTLVWRDGMADWQPYGQAKAPAGGAPPVSPGLAAPGEVLCAECGRSFPPDQVIRHGNLFVCGGCKPVFLQKLREGVSTPGTLNYAGFWIRFGAYFIDLILLEIVMIPLSFAIRAMVGGPVSPLQPNWAALFINTPISLGLVLAYYTFFVGKFGATPGKMATKLKVVNPDGSPVGYGKACGRYFAQIVSSLACCIGYLMIAWDPEKRALHDRMCSTRVIYK